MKTFNCIFGIFSILGAIYCMFFPGLTFLSTGWIVAILIGVLGICSVFESLSNPANKGSKEGKRLLANGAVGVILGIGATVISTWAMFSPALRGLFDMIILYLFQFWLFYIGWMGVYNSVLIKKTGSKKWILSLILGILTVLVGFYGLVHLAVSAVTIGYVIGIELLIYGARLLASSFEENA